MYSTYGYSLSYCHGIEDQFLSNSSNNWFKNILCTVTPLNEIAYPSPFHDTLLELYIFN